MQITKLHQRKNNDNLNRKVQLVLNGYGLLLRKNPLLNRPRESEMIVIMEDVYDQILKQNILKDDHIYRHRAQTALKAFTYNYLDLDVKQLFNDRKKIKALQNLRDRCMILKPDKGQGIVLINKMDYYQSLERLFGDRKKFLVLDHDPTLTKLATIRNYIQTIYKPGKISETEMKEMRPKVVKVGRAYGLPKIHKKYTD